MGAEEGRKEGRGPRKEGRDIRHYTHKRKINRTGDTGGRRGGSQSWMSRRFHAKGQAKWFARLAPRPQADIIISLCAKMRVWFYFNLSTMWKDLFHLMSYRISLNPPERGQGLPRPSGAQEFQDELPF